MTVLILLQIVLPVGLLAWLALLPAPSILGYLLQAIGVGLFLFAISLIGVWMVPPWWVPWIYGVLWVLTVALHLSRQGMIRSSLLPSKPLGWAALGVSVMLMGCGGWFGGIALDGRRLPEGEVIDIAMPLGSGRYMVAQGGSRELVNGHLKVLDSSVARYRNWRGQSYALDLVGLDRFGLRADGWRPEDPARYAIFGANVYAPCAGEVIGAENGLPDMRVPEMDRENLPGNHVLLKCDEVVLVFAHLRRGSVMPLPGQVIVPGDLLGEVGNSGNSSEPHLHLHAQKPGTTVTPFPLASEPLALRIEGRFLVRNARIEGREWQAPRSAERKGRAGSGES